MIPTNRDLRALARVALSPELGFTDLVAVAELDPAVAFQGGTATLKEHLRTVPRGSAGTRDER